MIMKALVGKINNLLINIIIIISIIKGEKNCVSTFKI